MILTDKVVLVTGGGSGIGLELARQISEAGNIVYICGRNAAKLDAASAAHSLHAIVGDVTCVADQEKILSTIAAEHGRLDMLINNAGVLEAYDFVSDPNTLDRIEREMEINAKAPLTFTYRALPLLTSSEEPAVFFISSGLAYVASAGAPVYSGTKALIHHCAQTLRHQLAPLGISVFEAVPPVVATDMAKKLKSGNFKIMQPEDLVRQILQGMKDGIPEMNLGQSKQIKLMSRLAPAFLFRQFAKTEFN